jgi:hypothetical protein
MLLPCFHFLRRPALTDPADEFVLAVAVASECDTIGEFLALLQEKK